MNDSKFLRFLTVAPLVMTCAFGMEMVLSPAMAQSLVQSTSQSATQSPTSLDQSVNRLKPGDRIRLTVTGFPDLSGEQIILTDGTLQLPLAGAIAVSGQTPAEAVATLTTALLPYIRRPQVGLAVVSVRPPRISITGEVLRPGPRILATPDSQADTVPDTGGETVQTLSYALALAGGVTPNADLRNITIRRLEPPSRTGNPAEPVRTEIQVDLWQAIQTGTLAADLPIVDGDEIIVPTAQISSADQQQILNSTIAPTRITVQVAGSVRSPGSIQIAPSDGVNAAIAAAGGLTSDASRRLTLLRMSANGTLERQSLTFGEGSEPLREGDVIVASQSTANSILNTVGRILSPLSFFLNLF